MSPRMKLAFPMMDFDREEQARPPQLQPPSPQHPTRPRVVTRPIFWYVIGCLLLIPSTCVIVLTDEFFLTPYPLIVVGGTITQLPAISARCIVIGWLALIASFVAFLSRVPSTTPSPDNPRVVQLTIRFIAITIAAVSLLSSIPAAFTEAMQEDEFIQLDPASPSGCQVIIARDNNGWAITEWGYLRSPGGVLAYPLGGKTPPKLAEFLSHDGTDPLASAQWRLTWKEPLGSLQVAQSPELYFTCPPRR